MKNYKYNFLALTIILAFFTDMVSAELQKKEADPEATKANEEKKMACDETFNWVVRIPSDDMSGKKTIFTGATSANYRICLLPRTDKNSNYPIMVYYWNVPDPNEKNFRNEVMQSPNDYTTLCRDFGGNRIEIRLMHGEPGVAWREGSATYLGPC